MVYWALSLLMFTDLRWIKYKALGTDRELRAMYVRFEFFSAVKKLDVQFSLVVLATGLVFFHRTELETVFAIINGFLIFVEIAWEISGNRAVKHGSVGYAIAFFALSLLMPSFVLAVSVLALSGYPVLDGAQQAGAQGEVVALLLCAVFNRLLTMGCMASMVCAFGTSGYAKLRLLFARKAQRVIGIHGMRPPPVPICGCDFARCSRRCGPRCAACCCDKPRQAAWAMPAGYDSDSDSERRVSPAWGVAATGAATSVELSEAKSTGRAVPRTGLPRANPAATSAAHPPELTEEALAQPRDSFAAAYLAATTNQAREELKPPVTHERSRSAEAEESAQSGGAAGSDDSGVGDQSAGAAGSASAPRGAAGTTDVGGGGGAPDNSDAASTMTGASSRGGRERRRERRAARQANRGVGAV